MASRSPVVRQVLLVLAALAAVLAACAAPVPGQPAKPAQPAHTAQAGEPALTQVAGYQYADPPQESSARESTTRLVEQLESDLPGLVTASSVHEVRAGGDLVAWLVLLAVDSAALGQTPGVYVIEGLLSYGVGAAMPTMSQTTVAGQRVGIAEADVDGHHRVAACVGPQDGVLTLVLSSSRQTVDTVVAGLVTGPQGSGAS